MKYIRTLQNLKRIMDYSPELVKYEKYVNGTEKYTYQDNYTYFRFTISDNKLTVYLDACMHGNGKLNYDKKDGEWVLDASTSVPQVDVTEKNKGIKEIVKAIKEGKYVPVSEEKEIELTQREKEKFISWLKWDIDIDEEKEEIKDFTLNFMLSEEHTAVATIKNDILMKVSIIEKVDSVHENGFTWSLQKDKSAVVYGSFVFDNKSNFFSGTTENYELEERPDTQDEMIEKTEEEVKDLTQEEKEKTASVSTDETEQPTIHTNNDTPDEDQLKEKNRVQCLDLLEDFSLKNDLAQMAKNYAFSDLESCLYKIEENIRTVIYINAEYKFISYFVIDDNENKDFFRIYFWNDEKNITVENDFMGNEFINGGDWEFNENKALERIRAPEKSGAGIEYRERRRIVESDVIEGAIQEFIYKVKDGELFRDTDCFYEVLKSNNITRVIESIEWDNCEILCTVPNNDNRFIIELGYENSSVFEEMINRIDYHAVSKRWC